MADEFCSNCGEKLQKGMEFCGSCGAKTVTAAQETQAPQTESSGPIPAEAEKPAVVGTPPTKDEKNKLILFMVLSIIIPIVGIVFGIIFYNKKDQKSGMFYLMCGIAGIMWGILGAAIPYGIGWALGVLVVAAVFYNGLKQINTGLISTNL